MIRVIGFLVILFALAQSTLVMAQEGNDSENIDESKDTVQQIDTTEDENVKNTESETFPSKNRIMTINAVLRFTGKLIQIIFQRITMNLELVWHPGFNLKWFFS